eukprot:616825-Prymnesium_polylepis.1
MLTALCCHRHGGKCPRSVGRPRSIDTIISVCPCTVSHYLARARHVSYRFTWGRGRRTLAQDSG